MLASRDRPGNLTLPYLTSAHRCPQPFWGGGFQLVALWSPPLCLPLGTGRNGDSLPLTCLLRPWSHRCDWAYGACGAPPAPPMHLTPSVCTSRPACCPPSPGPFQGPVLLMLTGQCLRPCLNHLELCLPLCDLLHAPPPTPSSREYLEPPFGPPQFLLAPRPHYKAPRASQEGQAACWCSYPFPSPFDPLCWLLFESLLGPGAGLRCSDAA